MPADEVPRIPRKATSKEYESLLTNETYQWPDFSPLAHPVLSVVRMMLGDTTIPHPSPAAF